VKQECDTKEMGHKKISVSQLSIFVVVVVVIVVVVTQSLLLITICKLRVSVQCIDKVML